MLFVVTSCSKNDSADSNNIDSDLPYISTNINSILFEDTMITKSSTTKSIIISSKNINSNINISVSDEFELSTDNTTFGKTLSIMSLIHISEPTRQDEISCGVFFL